MVMVSHAASLAKYLDVCREDVRLVQPQSQLAEDTKLWRGQRERERAKNPMTQPLSWTHHWQGQQVTYLRDETSDTTWHSVECTCP